MSDSLETLLRSLLQSGIDLDAEGALDSVWLATRMSRTGAGTAASPEAVAPTVVTDDPGNRPTRPTVKSAPVARAQQPVTTPAPRVTYAIPEEHLEHDDQLAEEHGRLLTLERAAALPGGRDLSKALRALRRRVRAPGVGRLDVDATVRRAIDEHVFIPTYLPARERWLDVLIVADHGLSMIVWKELVDEFTRMARGSGTFRSVRSYWLDTDSTPVTVRPQGRGARPKTAELLPMLAHAANRSVILVISDCVGAAWLDGRVPALLQAWSDRLPVALLQVTPEWFWPRTALGDALDTVLESPSALSLNGDLQWDRVKTGVSGLTEAEAGPFVPVPVATLTPASMTALARLLSGIAGQRAPGVVFDVSWNGVQGVAAGEVARSPEKRVAQFYSLTSPAARRLATAFASSPVLTLGLLRLLRRDLLAGSDQFVEAEVLLGGLLRVPRDAASWDAGASLPLEFVAGVQELLRDSAVAADVLRVLTHASAVAADGSRATFTAWLRDPESAADALDPAASAFMKSAAAVLERLGGSYARVVRRVLPTPQAKPGDGVVPEAIEVGPDSTGTDRTETEGSGANAAADTPPPQGQAADSDNGPSAGSIEAALRGFTPQSQKWRGTRAVLLVTGLATEDASPVALFHDVVESRMGGEDGETTVYVFNSALLGDWNRQELSHRLRDALGDELDAPVADFVIEMTQAAFAPGLWRAARDGVLAALESMMLDGTESGIPPNNQQISIIGHSFGAFALYEALHFWVRHHQSGRPEGSLHIDNVILLGSPLGVVRAMGNRLGQAVAERAEAATFDRQGLQIPGRAERHKLTIGHWMTVVGDQDPVTGYVRGQRRRGLFAEMPGEELRVLNQSAFDGDFGVRPDAWMPAEPGVTSARLGVDNPHALRPYLERMASELQVWLTDWSVSSAAQQAASNQNSETNVEQVEQPNAEQVEQQNVKQIDQQNVKQIDQQNSEQVEQPNAEQVEQQNVEQVEQQDVQQIVQQNFAQNTPQNSADPMPSTVRVAQFPPHELPHVELFGREGDLSKLHQWIRGAEPAGSPVRNFTKTRGVGRSAEPAAPLVLVSGEAGIGKTSLLAGFVQELLAVNPSLDWFYWSFATDASVEHCLRGMLEHFETQQERSTDNRNAGSTESAADADAIAWRKQILWVDDRPQNNASERRALESFGVVFTLARSTTEALQFLSKQQFGAIISDMGRKEGSTEGYALLDAVRASDPRTPFFIYAGSNTGAFRRQAAERGAQGSTNRMDELVEMVRRALDLRVNDAPSRAFEELMPALREIFTDGLDRFIVFDHLDTLDISERELLNQSARRLASTPTRVVLIARETQDSRAGFSLEVKSLSMEATGQLLEASLVRTATYYYDDTSRLTFGAEGGNRAESSNNAAREQLASQSQLVYALSHGNPRLVEELVAAATDGSTVEELRDEGTDTHGTLQAIPAEASAAWFKRLMDSRRCYEWIEMVQQRLAEGDLARALESADEALSIAARLNSPKRSSRVRMASALMARGAVASAREDWEQTSAAYADARGIFGLISEPAGRASATAGLARARFASARLEEALELAIEAGRSFAELNNHVSQFEVVMLQTTILRDLNRIDEAQQRVREALSLTERLNMPALRAQALLLQGKLLAQTKNWIEAVISFKVAEEQFASAGDKVGIEQTLAEIQNAHEASGNIPEAIASLRRRMAMRELPEAAQELRRLERLLDAGATQQSSSTRGSGIRPQQSVTDALHSSVGDAPDAVQQRVIFEVSGKLQGTFYRTFAHTQASDLRLEFKVKALRNGRIQLKVVANAAQLDELERRLRVGPPNAVVEDVHRLPWPVETQEPLNPSGAPVAVVAVSLSPAPIVAGTTTQATATLKDANYNTLTGRAIAWSTSNTVVATVNSNGLVTSLVRGFVDIIATSEGKSGYAALVIVANS